MFHKHCLTGWKRVSAHVTSVLLPCQQALQAEGIGCCCYVAVERHHQLMSLGNATVALCFSHQGQIVQRFRCLRGLIEISQSFVIIPLVKKREKKRIMLKATCSHLYFILTLEPAPLPPQRCGNPRSWEQGIKEITLSCCFLTSKIQITLFIYLN